MFPKSMTVREIAELIGATVEGDAGVEIRALSPMDQAGAGELSFALDARRLAKLSSCQAQAVIVPNDAEVPEAFCDKVLLRVASVNRAMASLLGHLASLNSPAGQAGVDSSAAVDPQAQLANDAAIGPCAVVQAGAKIGARSVISAGAFVGAGVVIGEDCLLSMGVVVRVGCVLGSRVRVGPNTVIGSDGFGYFFEDGKHWRVPHAGNVIIEDDVELGACCCVDRAKFGSTTIGAGSKIDNLVQIAHNVQIGPGCVMAAQSGIAGSSKLGSFVVMGGGTSVSDNVFIADGATFGARAGIAQNVTQSGAQMAGTPARDGKQFMRELFALKKLPDLLSKVRDMEKRIKKIESTTNDQEKRSG